MQTTIEPAGGATYCLDVKRFHVPFILKTTCPGCGGVVSMDFTKSDYLTSPPVNTPFDLDLYHWCGDGDDHEWTTRVILNLDLTDKVDTDKVDTDTDADQKLLRQWCDTLAGALGVTAHGDFPLDDYFESLLERVRHLAKGVSVEEKVVSESQCQHLADAVGAVGDAATDFFALLAMVRSLRAASQPRPPVGEEPEKEASYELADAFRDVVLAKTEFKPSELVCPREKSAMTPCVARDGRAACSDSGHCVGCEMSVALLLSQEVV